MKKTILIVDDDRSVREALANVLLSENYQTIIAPNGAVGIDMATDNSIDLVLLDLNMPKKDGWETFETLNSRFPDLPILIITARSNQLFRALAAEAVALMEKPLDVPELLRTIERLLKNSRHKHHFHYAPASG